MAQNVELKARLTDYAAAESTALRLATTDLGELAQTDTYFHCPQGRLKLREMPDQAELIFYKRPDDAAIRTSTYQLVPTHEPAKLKQALSLAYGMRVVVKKVRRVVLWHNVRIHLDRVQSLGEFLEFEAVTGNGVDLMRAGQQVQQLQSEFGIGPQQIFNGSYCDLLEALSR